MGSPFDAVRGIDYTVIFTDDLQAMRGFYEGVLRFRFVRALTPRWLEFAVGGQTLALCQVDTAPQAPALQLAFRVPPDMVAACAAELDRQGIAIDQPVTDQPFGHRTLFFRDPQGTRLEIYAEI